MLPKVACQLLWVEFCCARKTGEKTGQFDYYLAGRREKINKSGKELGDPGAAPREWKFREKTRTCKRKPAPKVAD
jgi:hypothetical protein